jgi:hypothetical protein
VTATYGFTSDLFAAQKIHNERAKRVDTKRGAGISGPVSRTCAPAIGVRGRLASMAVPELKLKSKIEQR